MNFAIIISKFYLDRCMCLINSLEKYKVKIYILCYDEESFNILKKKNKKKIIPIKFTRIIKFDTELEEIAKKRSIIDQIITSRPVFINFLNKKLKIKKIFLLDADIFFFSNPLALLKIVEDSSIAFAKHNFTRDSRAKEKKYGKYNAGFLYFNLDINGKKFLKLWSTLCKKWCFFEAKNNKFSDQKYLEYIIKKTKNVKIIDNPGVNLAPWNLENKNITNKNKLIYVNEHILIFYHFHGLRNISNRLYFLGIQNYGYAISTKLKKILYNSYVNLLYKKNFTLKLYNIFYWKNNIEINFLKPDIFLKLRQSLTFIKKLFYNDFFLVKKL